MRVLLHSFYQILVSGCVFIHITADRVLACECSRAQNLFFTVSGWFSIVFWLVFSDSWFITIFPVCTGSGLDNACLYFMFASI